MDSGPGRLLSPVSRIRRRVSRYASLDHSSPMSTLLLEVAMELDMTDCLTFR